MDPDVLFVHDFDPDFSIFGFTLRYYGVLFAASFLVGYFFMRRMFIRLGRKEEEAQTFYFLALAITVISARCVHVFFYDWDSFMARPGMLVEIWNGGVASHGGIIGLILSGYIFSKWKKIRYLDLLDMVAQSLALSAFFIRVGNFFNAEIVGRVTDVPWAMIFKTYDNQPRHPSQLYEAAYGLAILITLWFVEIWREKKKREDPSMRWTGLLFFIGAILYPTCRFLAEYVQEYQTLSSSFPFTMGQLLSMPFILVGIGGLFWLRKNKLEGLDPVTQADKIAWAEAEGKPVPAEPRPASKKARDASGKAIPAKRTKASAEAPDETNADDADEDALDGADESDADSTDSPDDGAGGASPKAGGRSSKKGKKKGRKR